MDVEPVLKGLCAARRQDDIAQVSSADSAQVIEQHRPCTQGQNTAVYTPMLLSMQCRQQAATPVLEAGVALMHHGDMAHL